MKKTSYIGKTKTDLLKALAEKRESIRTFRFGNAGAKTRSVKDVYVAKKDIARIMTELNKQ